MERKIYNELSKKEESYTLIRKLNKVNNGQFYLYSFEGKKVVIKELVSKVDEDGQIEINKELYSYERLELLGIRIPKLLGYNYQENIMIKEYLEGKDLLGMIRDKKLTKENYIELLKYGERVNSDNLNIDYFPNNFILKEEKLYYVNYKVFPYTENLNLRNWGIYYWINSEGIREYMTNGSDKAINLEGEKNPIITEEMNLIRDKLYKEYIEWKYK